MLGGCLMIQISRRSGSPSGLYMLRGREARPWTGSWSWSRTGWRPGCRMYVQPKSAKAAR